MRFERLLHMPTAWTSVYGRFVVHFYEGRVSVSDMDRMQVAGERWNVRHPEKRVEMAVVLPTDTRMSSQERTRMAQLIKVGEKYRAASATVILAEGLLASMHRSVLTAMMMLAPAPHPAKVFGSISDALAWLTPHIQAVCGDSIGFQQINAAVQAHLREFKARPDRPEIG